MAIQGIPLIFTHSILAYIAIHNLPYSRLPAPVSTSLSYVPPLLLYFCIFSITVTIHQVVQNSYTAIKAWRKYGAVTVPRVKGALPFNLDQMYYGAQAFWTDPIPGRHIHDLILKYNSEKRIINMSFLGKDIIFTEDPELVKHVLTGPGWTNFPKGERFQGIFNDFLGVGIFNSDGAQWKHHRSLTRPFFSKDEISNIETFDKHASIMINIVKKLRSHPQKTRASFPAQIVVGKSAAIDIQDLVGRFTLDSATEFLFGTPVDSLYEVDSTLFSQESKEKKINAGDFFRAFNEVQEKTQRRLQADPFWKVAELVHNPIKAEMKHISPLVDSIIESALKSPATISADQEKKGDLKSTVFLNHLIAVTQDPKEIRDELLNVLLAARDTTHSLIISTIYEMSRNVVIWKKLRDEVIAAFPFKAEPVDVDAMRKLKYLRSVLNESLRMHPPVPFNFRSTVNEDIIDIKGTRYYLPAKCPIAYGLYPMQRREDLWGPDAGIYDPERWLDSRSKRQTSNPFIFQPFSAGPRICLGQQYAYNEASLCIVRLLQHFESVEWASDAQPSESIYTNEKGQPDIARYAAITLSFRGGFWVRFTEAKN